MPKLDNEVVVTNIKMPFGSMVLFMVKLAIATIPAMIILTAVGTLTFALINFFCNYSAKKVKRSKKRLDRVFWRKAKLHLCPSVLSILA